MKLKEHPDFPKKKGQPKLSKTMPAGDIYDIGFNNARAEIGEIDLNELIAEEKVVEFLQLWNPRLGLCKYALTEAEIRDIAKAIKSSDIWKGE